MVANVNSMAYFGETPWHGLGQQLTEEDTKNVEKVREKSGVIWNVKESEIFSKSNENFEIVKGFKSLRRSDNNEVLSVVSDDYHVVQPEEIFNFYKHFVDKYNFRLHTAGSLDGGRKVWVLADIGKELTLRNEDHVGAYLLLVTSFDRSLATISKFTTIRTVCQNTLNIALQENTKAIKVSHSSKFDQAKMILDVEALGRGFDTFSENAKVLSQRIVNRQEVVNYFLNVLYPNVENVEALSTRQSNTVKFVHELFEKGKGQELAGTTAWGLVNAVTLYVDHEKGRTRDSALNSAWFGAGEKLKDSAFTEALRLVA